MQYTEAASATFHIGILRWELGERRPSMAPCQELKEAGQSRADITRDQVVPDNWH